MGGCEYIKSIDRVGLKVVLRNLKKVNTIADVISELRKNKASKDKVPENYEKSI
jgi:hypothetical protein